MKRLWGLVAPILLLLMCAALPARAAVSLTVDVGWDGHYRAGRWAPLFVTLSDTTARAVIVEVYTPHSHGFGMHTRIALSVTPTPATYPIYVPMPQSIGDLTITVWDARTERRLVVWPEMEQRGRMVFGAATADVLIGTSGQAATMRSLSNASTRDGTVQNVFIQPMKLPLASVGYDAFNVLVLNQPDLNRMDPQQHQAIAEWVRGGGQLVMWPGADPIPPASPLVNVLPCVIAENVTLETDPKLLETFTLPARFAQMRGRELLPKPEAERIAPLGEGGPVGWRWRIGLGQVLVLPFDPTFFVFRDNAAANRFWTPLLTGMIDLRPPGENDPPSYYYWNDPLVRRRSAAFNKVADLLGNVPGVGQFGFSYVAVVLIGLMFIVGPVDWFVLRYLGRQPWTWVTTSGWIALVTVGALFVGHLFKSGDLHFRTLRVIDQVDGRALGALDLACIYSPRTRLYELDVPRESWWQPGGEIVYGYEGPMRNATPFTQDAVSNRPAAMLINVWNLRFLEGQSTIDSAGPLIESSLERTLFDPGDSSKNVTVRGTIQNKSDRPMRDIVVRVRGGALQIEGELAPGAVTNVDQELGLGGAVFDWQAYAQVNPARVAGSSTASPATALGTYWTYCDLALGRSQRIDQILDARDDVACIYAEVVDPQPGASIASDGAKQKHWQVVRALVPISVSESTGKKP